VKNENISGEGVIKPAKWSRRATVANAGGAMLTIFAAIFMMYTKTELAAFNIYLINMVFSIKVGIFRMIVLIGGVLGGVGAALCWRRKFYAGAIGVTVSSFILGGSLFSLLALVFLLAAKEEFARKVE